MDFVEKVRSELGIWANGRQLFGYAEGCELRNHSFLTARISRFKTRVRATTLRFLRTSNIVDHT